MGRSKIHDEILRVHEEATWNSEKMYSFGVKQISVLQIILCKLEQASQPF